MGRHFSIVTQSIWHSLFYIGQFQLDEYTWKSNIENHPKLTLKVSNSNLRNFFTILILRHFLIDQAFRHSLFNGHFVLRSWLLGTKLLKSHQIQKKNLSLNLKTF